jgi:hypothetical protein
MLGGWKFLAHTRNFDMSSAAALRIAEWEADRCAYADLFLSCMGMTELPLLPPNVQGLYVCGNSLTSLGPRPLPAGLKFLNCGNNQLVTLGPHPLPDTLEVLICSSNQLRTLGRLPRGLRVLSCCGNNLRRLRLPPGLDELRCQWNTQLVLRYLPPRLRRLLCDGVLTRALPAGLQELTYTGEAALAHALPPGLHSVMGPTIALFAASCSPSLPRYNCYFYEESGADWRAAWVTLGRRNRSQCAAVLPSPALLYV